MKKLPLILSSISLLGTIALLLVVFLSGGNKKKEVEDKTTPGDVKIAYVQTDSILLNYKMAIDMNEDFVMKQKQYSDEFGYKRADLEKQAAAFQEKVQRGGFLTEDRAMKERDRILAQQEDMKKMDYEYSNKLSDMESKIQQQLVDSIVSYVKEYNKIHNYTYIFSNNGNIIIGEAKYNITKDILDGLNARYLAAKRK
jgi:outer membrane protein